MYGYSHFLSYLAFGMMEFRGIATSKTFDVRVTRCVS
jgi:hypothetical protein